MIDHHDDCKLFGAAGDGENRVQHDLSNMEEWLRIRQQQFSAKKCKAMHFGHHYPRGSYEIFNERMSEAIAGFFRSKNRDKKYTRERKSYSSYGLGSNTHAVIIVFI